MMYLRTGFAEMATHSKRTPDLSLSPWEAHKTHERLIASRVTTQKTVNALSVALHEARNAEQRAFSALYNFEVELQAHEEATGEKPGRPYVTLDPETEETHWAKDDREFQCPNCEAPVKDPAEGCPECRQASGEWRSHE
jgi:hypothetical protein